MIKLRNILLLAAIIIPAITASFRTSGSDYDTYIEYYYIIKELKFESGREILWVLVNLVSPNKYIMLFLSAFIFLFFSSKCISTFVKNSKSMAWSIVLLVFYGTFLNIMRQMIAVAIIIYSFKYLFKKRWLCYAICVLCAAMFHKSSAVMIIMPIVLHIANKVKHYNILIVIAMILLPLSVPIIFKVFNYFGVYTKYAQEIKFKFEPQFIICMLPPVILYYFTGGAKAHSKVTNNFFYVYLIAFPMQTMGFMGPYLDRLTYNFYFVLILLVPMIIDEVQNIGLKNKLKFAMDGWFLIYNIAVFMIAGTADVYPYINYSQGKNNGH